MKRKADTMETTPMTTPDWSGTTPQRELLGSPMRPRDVEIRDVPVPRDDGASPAFETIGRCTRCGAHWRLGAQCDCPGSVSPAGPSPLGLPPRVLQRLQDRGQRLHWRPDSRTVAELQQRAHALGGFEQPRPPKAARRAAAAAAAVAMAHHVVGEAMQRRLEDRHAEVEATAPWS
jgi:hypothetical protein